MKNKQLTKKEQKVLKQKYAFGTYKPNKNSVSVVYEGKQYLSKIQCMILNNLTRKELDEYLKNNINS